MTSRHRTRRSQRGGGVTLFLLVSLTGITLILGLVVDWGAKVSAATEAEAAAASAARAGANAAAASQLGGGPPSTSAAYYAAHQHLAQAGVTGTVQILPGGTVRVTASQTRPTKFLSIVGINHVTGTGEADVNLYRTGDRP
ncbi:Uncharacterised protein [Mycobacteroides abscessus subsp. abscessus]|nr:Uncharacterised protein [Mycobacteroides abscessus subsp. abscessus]